jgi:hypothetical protein
MAPLNFLDKGLGFAKVASAPVTAAAASAAKAVDGGVRAAGPALSGLAGEGSGAAMSAGMGRGLSIGALSVPQAWAAAPTASSVATELQSWKVMPLSESAHIGPAGMPLMPLAGMPGRNTAGAAASRFELRASVVGHSPAGG